jgi:hypothetical protein
MTVYERNRNYCQQLIVFSRALNENKYLKIIVTFHFNSLVTREEKKRI